MNKEQKTVLKEIFILYKKLEYEKNRKNLINQILVKDDIIDTIPELISAFSPIVGKI